MHVDITPFTHTHTRPNRRHGVRNVTTECLCVRKPITLVHDVTHVPAHATLRGAVGYRDDARIVAAAGARTRGRCTWELASLCATVRLRCWLGGQRVGAGPEKKFQANLYKRLGQRWTGSAANQAGTILSKKVRLHRSARMMTTAS